MGLIVATPISAKERDAIGAGELWHFSKALPSQVTTEKLAGGGFANARVRLSAPTGWQLDFWKFIRDVSVWDLRTFSAENRGQYLYFFLGEPGAWTRRVNVQAAPLTIRIRGADFLAATAMTNLFHRAIDKTVVLKGDYAGPALLDPAP